MHMRITVRNLPSWSTYLYEVCLWHPDIAGRAQWSNKYKSARGALKKIGQLRASGHTIADIELNKIGMD